MLDEKLEKLIRKNYALALKELEFETIHKVMKFLDWTWITLKGEIVPEKEEMIETTNELLDNAIEDLKLHPEKGVYGHGSTGGFCVEFFETGSVDISFQLTWGHGDTK